MKLPPVAIGAKINGFVDAPFVARYVSDCCMRHDEAMNASKIIYSGFSYEQ